MDINKHRFRLILTPIISAGLATYIYGGLDATAQNMADNRSAFILMFTATFTLGALGLLVKLFLIDKASRADIIEHARQLKILEGLEDKPDIWKTTNIRFPYFMLIFGCLHYLMEVKGKLGGDIGNFVILTAFLTGTAFMFFKLFAVAEVVFSRKSMMEQTQEEIDELKKKKSSTQP